jgi:hypothetical protein
MEEGSLKDGVPAPFGQLTIVASPGEGDAVDSAKTELCSSRASSWCSGKASGSRVKNRLATGSLDMYVGQVLGIDHMASIRSGRSARVTTEAITAATYCPTIAHRIRS